MRKKSEMYEELFRRQEEIFKVIANQKRLEIIQLLSGRELSVADMTAMLGIRQANVSQHLALLRQAGILTSHRAGTRVLYSLTDERVSEAVGLIRAVLQEQSGSRVDMQTLSDGEGLYPVVTDVVCGMRISASHAGGSSRYGGRMYYFCAAGCKESFEAVPARYVSGEDAIHG